MPFAWVRTFNIEPFYMVMQHTHCFMDYLVYVDIQTDIYHNITELKRKHAIWPLLFCNIKTSGQQNIIKH